VNELVVVAGLHRKQRMYTEQNKRKKMGTSRKLVELVKRAKEMAYLATISFAVS